MFNNIKEEIKSFLEDMNNNIKDKDDLNYVKLRTARLLDAFADELEHLIDYKEEQLNEILKKQEYADLKIKELQRKVENVYQDIYEDEGSFLISCPYCGEEFDDFVDEDLTEIKCPECNNIIELDWSGNPDDEPDFNNCQDGYGENYPHCNGCE